MENLPKATAKQLQLVLFRMILDCNKSLPGCFLVVCLLGRITALVRVKISHLEARKQSR